MSELDLTAWKRSCADLRAKIGNYQRSDLPGLTPIFDDPNEILEPTAHYLVDRRQAITTTGKIIEKLEKACREERRRGIAGDWTYSKPRHEAIYRALDAERLILRWLLAEASFKDAA